MPARTLTNAQLFVGSNEIAQYTGSFDVGSSVALSEARNLAAGGYEVKIPAVFSATSSFNGNADYDAATAVNRVFNVAAKGTQYAVGVVQDGTAAVAGGPAIFTRGVLEQVKLLGGGTGETAKFSMTVQSDTAEINGVLGAPLAARTTSGLTGTAVQLGAVGTGPAGVEQRLWAALFVTAAAGTNLAVSIQSDNASNFPSAATALSFSTVSAAGWQFTSAAGPMTDDWFRVVSTVASGTFTFAVLMGVW